jgi:hypothetical protein
MGVCSLLFFSQPGADIARPVVVYTRFSKMEDGKEGIAGILGGADHDDALWLHNFTDHDGERKVLAWRSPNQAGEYILPQAYS